MAAWKHLSRACAAALVALGGAGDVLAQGRPAGPVPVTVYDPGFEPYTVYGRAEAGGAVIVFDQTPLTPFAETRAPAAVPRTAPAPPDPGPPIETAAGGATPSQAATPERPAVPAQTSAQTQSPGDPAAGKRYVDGVYAVNTDYLLSYPLNAYRFFSAPARFDRSDWITAALVAGAGSALFLLDESLMDFWQNDVKSGGTGDAADVFREFGESTTVLIGSVAAYALAEALDSTGAVDARREKSAALLTLQSFLLTQGIITGTKYLTGRNRPEDTDDAFDFEGPSKGDSNASFPSGHAGSAFAVATVLSETYGYDNPWVPWVAYSLATGTALARVDDNRHWSSDVFFGAAVGYFVGKTVTRYSPFLERNNITLLPFSQDGAGGVGLDYKF